MQVLDEPCNPCRMSITITAADLANDPDTAARSVLDLMPRQLTPAEVAAFAYALVEQLAHELHDDEPEADYTIAAQSAAVSLAVLVDAFDEALADDADYSDDDDSPTVSLMPPSDVDLEDVDLEDVDLDDEIPFGDEGACGGQTHSDDED